MLVAVFGSLGRDRRGVKAVVTRGFEFSDDHSHGQARQQGQRQDESVVRVELKFR
jgi:hypothetical protein